MRTYKIYINFSIIQQLLLFILAALYSFLQLMYSAYSSLQLRTTRYIFLQLIVTSYREIEQARNYIDISTGVLI